MRSFVLNPQKMLIYNKLCHVNPGKTVELADRAYREPVYQVVGQYLKGVFPAGTGLIVDGFASPRILVEIDVEAVVQD